MLVIPPSKFLLEALLVGDSFHWLIHLICQKNTARCSANQEKCIGRNDCLLPNLTVTSVRLCLMRLTGACGPVHKSWLWRCPELLIRLLPRRIFQFTPQEAVSILACR